MIGILGILIVLVSRSYQSDIGRAKEEVLSQLCATFKAALSQFNLEERTKLHAACPSCHCTYAPNRGNGRISAYLS